MVLPSRVYFHVLTKAICSTHQSLPLIPYYDKRHANSGNFILHGIWDSNYLNKKPNSWNIFTRTLVPWSIPNTIYVLLKFFFP